MRWIDSNNQSTDKNVVDVDENDTIGVNFQCNMNVEVGKLIDSCILFVYLNKMVVISLFLKLFIIIFLCVT